MVLDLRDCGKGDLFEFIRDAQEIESENDFAIMAFTVDEFYGLLGFPADLAELTAGGAWSDSTLVTTRQLWLGAPIDFKPHL